MPADCPGLWTFGLALGLRCVTTPAVVAASREPVAEREDRLALLLATRFWRVAGQRISPEMRFTEPATMTTPNRYDNNAWASAVRRKRGWRKAVSDTW